MKVEVFSLGTGKRKDLTAVQAKDFLEELDLVMKRPAGKGVFPGIAADCYVEVTKNKKKTQYGVYGRTVIMDTKTKKSWQFYFGLLLLEWLNL